MGQLEVLIVPVLNRYDLLDRMLRSVDVSVETVVVVDNGGRLRVDELPANPFLGRRFVWQMPSNLGVAPSWNLGIKATPKASGWLIVNSDAWFPPGVLARMLPRFERGRVVRTAEDWACVWVGADVVRQVGLFSECFVPAYFEDNDYAWRCQSFGVEVEVAESVRHDNSSTIHSDPGYMAANNKSFEANSALYHKRVQEGLRSAGLWDLGRRLEYGWD